MGVSSLSIDTDFAAGAIEIQRLPARGDIELLLRDDTAADIRQWFNFRVSSPAKRRTLAILNAGEATFPNGWSDYRAFASADGRSWRRVPTDYEDGVLRIEHTPLGPVTQYAYFVPYGFTRLDRLVRRANRASHVDLALLGESVEERPLLELSFGDDDAERVLWIVGRQHPGETPASWALEGLIKRLCASDDEAVQRLLDRAVVRIVPMVNPDGVELGNMRTSASGANLNRVWDEPDDDSPEVAAILERIASTGVNLFLDVHSDESAEFAFAARSEGNPSVTDELVEREAQLTDLLETYCHEFLDEAFYDPDPPGAADLSCAANQIGERFGVPSITLELPMKDNGADKVRPGWNERRAMRFGAAMVDALVDALDED
jgi:murein tripeptide amidase MpaA